ncbi:dihydrolipoyl dehydrogenase [Rickettsiales bacterium LUAb2]
MAKEYDIVIMGGGPGGYVAAIRASQLGFTVAVVEKYKVGGVCLHEGCIPSKTIIRSSEVYQTIKHADEFGVSSSNLSLNFQKVKSRVEKVVNTLHGGVKGLLAANKIDVYYAEARIMGASIFSPLPGSICVPSLTNENEDEIIIPKNLIIATGSSVTSLKGLDIDGKLVIGSKDALDLTNLPKSIIIVGGGVIGVEWACLLNNLEVEVTLIEHGKYILPHEDIEISKELHKQLTKKGIKIINNAEVLANTLQKTDKNITISAKVNEKEEVYTADKLLVAVGRKANTQDIGLENTKIALDNKGHIEVDQDFRTKEKHIFAIGDVNGFMPLAHAASAQGIYVVEYIKGLNPNKIIKNNIPKCVYSSPEIASIGLTESEAINSGFKVKVSKFSTNANPKAMIYGEAEGFVKIITDTNTNDLLGVHIIGADATNLIGEAALAKFLDATALEIAKTIHPHPSLTESIMEAAAGIYNQSIHKH